MAASNATPSDEQTPTRRYAADDGVTNPGDRSSPTTTEDETHTSLWERVTAQRSKYVLAVGGLLAVALLGYGLLLGSGFLFSLLTNTYVQAGLAGTTVLGIGVVVGARRERETIGHTAELELMFPDGVQSWQGEYVELADGPAFKIYKGRSGLLRSQEFFSVKELAQQYPQLRAKRSMSGSDDAVIELNKAFTEVQLTDRGARVVSLCGDLRPVPYHGSAVFRAEPPEMAEKGRLQDANNLIQDLQSEIETKERRLGSLQNRIEDLIAQTGETREEIVDELVDMHQRLSEADSHRYSRQSNSESSESGLPPSAREAIMNGGDD